MQMCGTYLLYFLLIIDAYKFANIQIYINKDNSCNIESIKILEHKVRKKHSEQKKTMELIFEDLGYL